MIVYGVLFMQSCVMCVATCAMTLQLTAFDYSV